MAQARACGYNMAQHSDAIGVGVWRVCVVRLRARVGYPIFAAGHEEGYYAIAPVSVASGAYYAITPGSVVGGAYCANTHGRAKDNVYRVLTARQARGPRRRRALCAP